METTLVTELVVLAHRLELVTASSTFTRLSQFLGDMVDCYETEEMNGLVFLGRNGAANSCTFVSSQLQLTLACGHFINNS